MLVQRTSMAALDHEQVNPPRCVFDLWCRRGSLLEAQVGLSHHAAGLQEQGSKARETLRVCLNLQGGMSCILSSCTVALVASISRAVAHRHSGSAYSCSAGFCKLKSCKGRRKGGWPCWEGAQGLLNLVKRREWFRCACPSLGGEDLWRLFDYSHTDCHLLALQPGKVASLGACAFGTRALRQGSLPLL